MTTDHTRNDDLSEQIDEAMAAFREALERFVARHERLHREMQAHLINRMPRKPLTRKEARKQRKAWKRWIKGKL